MVQNLCLHYGPLLGTIDGEAFHDFPTPEDLADAGVEANLRALGFGYRAKYIAQTARVVAFERPKGWLESLRNTEPFDLDLSLQPMPPGGRPKYREAHEALLELQGVGPKVSDCVCLMGLGWSESVPVDTHVWQIATRDYKFGKGKHKSLTKATYDAIGDHFRNLWGREAGWAHSVLFAADLKTFSERLSSSIKVEASDTLIKTEIKTEFKTEIKTEMKTDNDDQIVLESIDHYEGKQEASIKSEIAIESSRAQRAKRRKIGN